MLGNACIDPSSPAAPTAFGLPLDSTCAIALVNCGVAPLVGIGCAPAGNIPAPGVCGIPFMLLGTAGAC